MQAGGGSDFWVAGLQSEAVPITLDLLVIWWVCLTKLPLTAVMSFKPFVCRNNFLIRESSQESHSTAISFMFKVCWSDFKLPSLKLT